MKQNNSLDMKQVVDWAFRVLFAIVSFLVQDMYKDIKEMRGQIPAMRVEIDNLKDQDLMKRFKSLKTTFDMKDEPTITYDSLLKTETL
jgi:hypothetical protein